MQESLLEQAHTFGVPLPRRRAPSIDHELGVHRDRRQRARHSRISPGSAQIVAVRQTLAIVDLPFALERASRGEEDEPDRAAIHPVIGLASGLAEPPVGRPLARWTRELRVLFGSGGVDVLRFLLSRTSTDDAERDDEKGGDDQKGGDQAKDESPREARRGGGSLARA